MPFLKGILMYLFKYFLIWQFASFIVQSLSILINIQIKAFSVTSLYQSYSILFKFTPDIKTTIIMCHCSFKLHIIYTQVTSIIYNHFCIKRGGKLYNCTTNTSKSYTHLHSSISINSSD